MAKMKIAFEGKCVLELEYNQATGQTKHLATKINIDVSENLKRVQYLDNEGIPNQDGSKILTNVFVQGLIGNIHQSHKRGFRNDAEHLRYIISELERGFITNADVCSSEF